MKVAFLSSSWGTTIGGVLAAQERGELKAQIACVVADKECPALQKARTAGVDAVLVDRAALSKEEFEEQLDSELRKRGVELVCLAGFMKILSHEFVNKWRDKIINVHPSLLPRHAGGMDLQVHRAVLEARERETGCTIHFVDEGIDTGRIIAQEKVAVREADTAESLKARVQAAEVALFVKVINDFAEKK
jgi:formyltetrahydrofolate-dependent phosphoribosylglycinamide formyltransferase